MKVAFYITPSGRSPVEVFIGGLPKADQARFLDVYDGIQRDGLRYARAQFRQLGGKLWEIKFAAPSGGYRVAYVVIDREQMVWLHAFKKSTQKTPASDLKIAETRMGELV